MLTSSYLLAFIVPDLPVALYRAHTPRLHERPVLVVSSQRSMGRVLAVSMEARQSGVREGMRFPTAKRLCPDAAVLPPNPEQQQRAEIALLQTAVAFSPCLERYGPGRLFVDTRGTQRLFGHSLDLASALQRTIADRLHLPSAMGLSPRKVWSDLAARVVAPSGILEVLPGQEMDFLHLIPPEWVNGVGPKTQELLRDMNITNLGMLRQFSTQELVDVFGPPGRHLAESLRQMAGDTLLCSAADIQALLPLQDHGVEAAVALPEDATAPDVLRAHLIHATYACGQALRTQQRHARQLKVTVFYSDGRPRTATQRLEPATALDSRLRQAAERAFTQAHERRIRLCRLRVRCEDLVTPSPQIMLFPDPDQARERHRLQALDMIRVRFGPNAIRSGAEMLAS